MRGRVRLFRGWQCLQDGEAKLLAQEGVSRDLPAETSKINTLTASSVPFFLPSCSAQGNNALSSLNLWQEGMITKRK
jgi:hypothetical protein